MLAMRHFVYLALDSKTVTKQKQNIAEDLAQLTNVRTYSSVGHACECAIYWD